jgi:hypothetical protein
VELGFGTTRLAVVSLAAAVLTIATIFLRLPSSQLRGCCDFGLRRLRPGRLPGGGHFRLLGSFRDRLGSGIWIRGWWDSGLDNTSPSNDVIPPLAQVSLLGRGPGLLFFRSGKVGCGGDFSATIERLLCKCGLSLFPLHKAPVVRLVVSSASTALRLFERGRATTGGVGAPTRRTEVRNRSFAAYFQSAGSACIAIGPSARRTIPPTLASRRVR